MNRQFKEAKADEKDDIRELTSSLQKQLIRVRSAEIRRRLKKVQKEQAQFIKNPYCFTRSLLGKAKSGMLMSSKEDVRSL